VIFVRHPATDAPADLCCGRLEVGLCAGAHAQIAACLDALPAASAVVVSPLRRCRLLAERIAARDGVVLRRDARLMEYHFGAWEGRRWSEIPRAESDPWTADFLDAAPPGGERFSELIARVRAAIADIPEGATVIAHAGPIRAARMLLEGVSPKAAFAEAVPHCRPLRLARRAA